MIPVVRLAKSGIVTSRLGFGTSRIHHLGRRQRESLLAAAIEAGFVHFDTAPSYGDGVAETDIGRVLRGRRDRLVIATKYGIPADPWLEALPMRPVFGVRSIARRVGLWAQRMPPLTAEGLRLSVEGSLRRLNSDRVDIVLLHEPAPERRAGPPARLEN